MQEPTKQLADHVFVFMARAIFKPSLSAAIAHYFSLSLKGILHWKYKILPGLVLFYR